MKDPPITLIPYEKVPPLAQFLIDMSELDRYIRIKT
jgi:hypothetical protein